MIGDDIVSDVGGAQACRIRGVQVRTGKFRYLYQKELLMPFILHGHTFWPVLGDNILPQ